MPSNIALSYQNQYDTSRQKAKKKYKYSPSAATQGVDRASDPYSRRQYSWQNRYGKPPSRVPGMTSGPPPSTFQRQYRYSNQRYGQTPSQARDKQRRINERRRTYMSEARFGNRQAFLENAQNYDPLLAAQKREQAMFLQQRLDNERMMKRFYSGDPAAKQQVPPDQFLRDMEYYMNSLKSPAYTPDQFMNLMQEYLQGPVSPMVQGELPPPAQPQQQEYYGGGYGYGYQPPVYYGRGGGGGGGGWGGYGGGGKDYLPSAYSPYDYGKGVEQQGQQYGNALNMSLWNI